MKKNDVVTVEVTDIGIGGEGIGKVDGYTLFIKDAVIGDTVEVKVMKAKKNYGYARLMRIVKESAFRVSARCPEARRCGGCQIQEMDYRKQLKFKNTKVRNNLIRLGSVEEELLDQIMEPIAGMEEPFRYRNKAQFPIGVDKEGNLIAGFYAGRTHQIIPVPNRDCVLGVPENKVILDQILDYMREEKISAYDEERHKGLVRHVLVRYGFTTKEIMVCLIINGDKLPSSEKLLEKLTKIPGMTSITYNINKEKTNVIMGSKVCPLWGQTYITDYIGNVKYQISPLSFYQVNPAQTEVLYGTALEYAGLTGKETVWDVYCGIGTISLFLAQKAQKVYGVEIVPQAIEDAKHNAEINEITNAEFFVGKAEEVLPEWYEKRDSKEERHADVIVVDPPRKGCDSVLLDTITAMHPDRIVYVSCDSATLARDLKYLTEKVCSEGKEGEYRYQVEKVQPVDMFPWSAHVETVVLLSHKKADSYIHIDVEFGEGEGKIPVDSIAKRAEAYKPKEKVTYKMIKEYIEAKYGFKVHTAYIAEVKRDLGLPMYDAPNAVEELKQPRKHPTPEKVEAIKDALRYFAVI